MVGVDAIGDLTHVLEDLFEKVVEGQLAASNDMTDLLFACHDRLAQMVEQVATQKPCPPANDRSQVEATSAVKHRYRPAKGRNRHKTLPKTQRMTPAGCQTPA